MHYKAVDNSKREKVAKIMYSLKKQKEEIEKQVNEINTYYIKPKNRLILNEGGNNLPYLNNNTLTTSEKARYKKIQSDYNLINKQINDYKPKKKKINRLQINQQQRFNPELQLKIDATNKEAKDLYLRIKNSDMTGVEKEDALFNICVMKAQKCELNYETTFNTLRRNYANANNYRLRLLISLSHRNAALEYDKAAKHAHNCIKLANSRDSVTYALSEKNAEILRDINYLIHFEQNLAHIKKTQKRESRECTDLIKKAKDGIEKYTNSIYELTKQRNKIAGNHAVVSMQDVKDERERYIKYINTFGEPNTQYNGIKGNYDFYNLENNNKNNHVNPVNQNACSNRLEPTQPSVYSGYKGNEKIIYEPGKKAINNIYQTKEISREESARSSNTLIL